MNMVFKSAALFMVLSALVLQGGCTAVALVDAAASTAVGVAKVAVKGTTAAVGALIPEGEEEDEK